jgi:hypothetical protein
MTGWAAAPLSAPAADERLERKAIEQGAWTAARDVSWITGNGGANL